MHVFGFSLCVGLCFCIKKQAKLALPKVVQDYSRVILEQRLEEDL